jgi:hypothetical protein
MLELIIESVPWVLCGARKYTAIRHIYSKVGDLT